MRGESGDNKHYNSFSLSLCTKESTFYINHDPTTRYRTTALIPPNPPEPPDTTSNMEEDTKYQDHPNNHSFKGELPNKSRGLNISDNPHNGKEIELDITDLESILLFQEDKQRIYQRRKFLGYHQTLLEKTLP